METARTEPNSNNDKIMHGKPSNTEPNSSNDRIMGGCASSSLRGMFRAVACSARVAGASVVLAGEGSGAAVAQRLFLAEEGSGAAVAQRLFLAEEGTHFPP